MKIYDLKKYFSIKTLKYLLMFVLIVGLCACGDEDGMGKGKDTNYDKQADCWQTYIIGAVIRVLDDLFNRGYNNLSSSQGATVIMIGFAVWMGFKFLKILPSFKAENLGEVLTEIGHKLFLCAFCAWAADSKGEMIWLLDNFIVPIYDTIMDLATRVTNVHVANNPSVTISFANDIGSVTFSNAYTNCEGSIGSIGGGISSGISSMANCVTCSIVSRLNTGVKIGIELICSLNISAMLLGLVLIVFFTLAKFGFVLFVVDSLFRLNFTVHLLPLMIMALPFAYTRKWATHCALLFLTSAGIMLFIGLLVALSVQALELIMSQLGPQLDEASLETTSPLLMAMFMISLLLFNIPGLGVSLSDKFIGAGAGDNFQKKVSKFAINLAKKAAAAGLAYVTGGATSAVTNQLEKYEWTREKLDSVRQINTKLQEKLNDLAGYNNE